MKLQDSYLDETKSVEPQSTVHLSAQVTQSKLYVLTNERLLLVNILIGQSIVSESVSVVEYV